MPVCPSAPCQVANEVAERASPRGAAKQGGQAKPWDGRTPISIAAGLILLVAVLPKVLLNTEPAPCCAWQCTGLRQRCSPSVLHDEAAADTRGVESLPYDWHIFLSCNMTLMWI